LRVSRPDGSQEVVCLTNESKMIGLTRADKVCLIHYCELPPQVMQYCCCLCIRIVERFGWNTEEYCAVARAIKEDMNWKYGPNWHCLVLVSGGSSLFHDIGCYLSCEYGPFTITVFKK